MDTLIGKYDVICNRSSDAIYCQRVVSKMEDGRYLTEIINISSQSFYFETAGIYAFRPDETKQQELEVMFNELKNLLFTTHDFFFRYFKEKYMGDEDLDLLIQKKIFYIRNKSLGGSKSIIAMNPVVFEYIPDAAFEIDEDGLFLEVDRNEYISLRRVIEDASNKAFSIFEASSFGKNEVTGDSFR